MILQLAPLDSWTRKHWYNLWNIDAFMCTSQDIGYSGSATAILDFPLQVRSDCLLNSTIGKLDPENMGVTVGTCYHVYNVKYTSMQLKYRFG